MSTNVDEQVVSLRMENDQFEREAERSTKTIDKLKSALSFKSSSKSVDDLGDHLSKIDFRHLTDAVDSISEKFTTIGIVGVTAMQRIANSAINTGLAIANAFTIAPISMGLQEYETQINAVQTILANTESKGTTLEDVNAALDELNYYADMTIYNFTQMTRNIGTFTAAGVDLETSTAAIKGIANLAAVSGSTSQQASNAMYQLSQALASGTVKLMDWNSVVNAGMGGELFKDALMETARVHGIAIDQILEEEGSFRDTLQRGWLSSDILLETLEKFTGDVTREELAAKGYTEEQIDAIMQLGKTANEAATKVKTFTQLKDTLMEAAQSGWTQSWEIIIGDFEEAKRHWTDISDLISGMLNDMSASRNKFLESVFGTRDYVNEDDWTTLANSLGADADALRSRILDIAAIYGVNVDSIRNDTDAFISSLSDGWLTLDIWNDAIEMFSNRVSKDMEPSWEQLNNVIGDVIWGKLGTGDDLVKNLTLMGYNAGVIKDLVTEWEETGTWTLDDFSKAVLHNDDSLRKSLPPLKEFQYLIQDVAAMQFKTGKSRDQLLLEQGINPEVLKSIEDAYGSVFTWDEELYTQILLNTPGLVAAYSDLAVTAEQLEYMANRATPTWSELNDVIWQMHTGELGQGDELIQNLTKMGLDYATMQELYQQWAETGSWHLDNMEDAKVADATIAALAASAIDADGAVKGLSDEMADSRNKLSGQEIMFKAITNALQLFKDICDAVSKAFAAVFPAKTRSDLNGALEMFDNFANSLSLNEEQLNKITNIFTGLFSVIKFVGTIVKSVFDAITTTLSNFFNIFKNGDEDISVLDKILNLFDSISTAIQNFTSKFDLSNIFSSDNGAAIKDFFGSIKDNLGKFINETFPGLVTAFNTIKDFIVGFFDDLGIGDKIREIGASIKSFFSTIFGGLFSGGEETEDVDPNDMVTANNPIGQVILFVKSLFSGTDYAKQVLEDARNKYLELIEKIKPVIENVKNFFKSVFHIGEGTEGGEAEEEPKENFFDKLSKFIVSLLNDGLYAEQVISEIKAKVLSIWEKVKEVFSNVKMFFSSLFGSSEEAGEETEPKETIFDKVSHFIKSIFNGDGYAQSVIEQARDKIGSILDKIISAFNSVKAFFKELFGLPEENEEGSEPKETIFDKVSHFIKSIFNGDGYAIGVIEDVKAKLSGVWETIKGAIEKVKEVINAIKSIFGGGEENLEEGQDPNDVRETPLDKVISIVDWVKGKAETAETSIQNAGDLIDRVNEKVKDFGNKLKEIFKPDEEEGTGEGEETSGAVSGLLGTRGARLEAASLQLCSFTERITPNLETADRGLGSLRDRIDSVKEKINSAVETIGNIFNGDDEKANATMEALGELSPNFKQFTDSFGEMSDKVEGFIGPDTALGSLIAKSDPESEGVLGGLFNPKSVGVLTAGIALLLTLWETGHTAKHQFGEFLEDLEDTTRALKVSAMAKSLQSVAVAIALLAATLVVLSFFDPDKLSAGVITIGSILLEVVGAMILLSKSIRLDQAGTIFLFGQSITAVATAIAVLAAAVVVLSLIKPERLITAVASLAAILGIIAIGVIVLKDAKLLKLSVSLITFSVALVALAASFFVFSLLPVASILLTLGKLGVIVGALATFSVALSLVRFDTASISLLAISAGLLVMSAALTAVAGIPFGILLSGLLKAVAIITVFAAMSLMFGFPAMQRSLVMLAVNIALVGIAFGAITGPLTALGMIPEQRLLAAAKAMIIIMGILAASGALLGAVPVISVGLRSLAGIFAIFGAASVAVAVSLMLIAATIPVLVANLIAAAALISSTKDQLKQGFVDAITVFTDSIHETAPAITQALYEIIEIIINAIGHLLSTLFESLVNFFFPSKDDTEAAGEEAAENITDGISEGLEDFEIDSSPLEKQMADLSDSLAGSFTKSLGPSLKTTASKAVVGIKDGISSKWNELKSGFSNTVSDIPGLFANIGGGISNTLSTVWDTVSSALFGTDLYKTMADGDQIVIGHVNGIVDNVKDFLDEKLPSITDGIKHFLFGQDFGTGYILDGEEIIAHQNGLFENIGEGISGAADTIKGWAQGVWGKFTAFMFGDEDAGTEGFVARLGGWLKDRAQDIGKGASDIFGHISSWSLGIWTTFKNFLFGEEGAEDGGFIAKAGTWLSERMDNIGTGLETALTTVKGWTSSIWSTFTEFLFGKTKTKYLADGEIIEYGAEGVLESAASWLTDIVDSAGSGLGTALDTVRNWGSQIWTTIHDALFGKTETKYLANGDVIEYGTEGIIDSVKTWAGNVWTTFTTFLFGEEGTENSGFVAKAGTWLSDRMNDIGAGLSDALLQVKIWGITITDALKYALFGKETIYNGMDKEGNELWIHEAGLFEKIGDGISGAGDTIKGWASSIWGNFTTFLLGEEGSENQGFIDQIKGWFGARITDIGSGVDTALTTVKTWASDIWNTFLDTLLGPENHMKARYNDEGIVETYLAREGGVVGSVSSWASDIWTAIKNAIFGEEGSEENKGIIAGIQGWAADIWSNFTKFFTGDETDENPGVIKKVKTWASGFWDQITTALFGEEGSEENKGIIDGIQTWAADIWDSFAKFFTGDGTIENPGVISAVKQWASNLWTKLKTYIFGGDYWTEGVDSGSFELIHEEGLINSIKNWGSDIWSKISAALFGEEGSEENTGFVNEIKSWASNVWSNFTKFLLGDEDAGTQGFIADIKGWLGDRIEDIKTGLPGAIESVKGIGASIADSLKSSLFGKDLYYNGMDKEGNELWIREEGLLDKIGAGVENATGPIKGWAQDIWGKFVSFLFGEEGVENDGLVVKLGTWISARVEDISAGLENIGPSISSIASDIWNKLIDALFGAPIDSGGTGREGGLTGWLGEKFATLALNSATDISLTDSIGDIVNNIWSSLVDGLMQKSETAAKSNTGNVLVDLLFNAVNAIAMGLGTALGKLGEIVSDIVSYASASIFGFQDYKKQILVKYGAIDEDDVYVEFESGDLDEEIDKATKLAIENSTSFSGLHNQQLIKLDGWESAGYVGTTRFYLNGVEHEIQYYAPNGQKMSDAEIDGYIADAVRREFESMHGETFEDALKIGFENAEVVGGNVKLQFTYEGITLTTSISESEYAREEAQASIAKQLADAFKQNGIEVEIPTSYMVSLTDAGENAGQGAANGVLGAAVACHEAGAEIADETLDGYTAEMDEASPSKEMMKLGRYAGEGAVLGVLEKCASAYAAGISLASSIIHAFDNRYQQFKSLGGYLVKGLSEGIYNSVDYAILAATHLVDSVKLAFQNGFQINSPSRITESFGRFLDIGLGKGIIKNTRYATDASESAARATLSTFNGILQSVSDYIDGSVDTQPTIRPVLDLSEVEQGFSKVDTMFSSSRAYAVAGHGLLAGIGDTANASSPAANTYNVKIEFTGPVNSEVDVERAVYTTLTRMQAIARM